jgi:membrane protease YdiL (CAAX protease family)
VANPVTLFVRRPVAVRIGVGVAGLWGALALRIAVAGVDGVRSLTAGVLFAGALAAVAAVTASRVVAKPFSWAACGRLVGVGVVGAVVLCVPAAIRHADGLGVVLPLDGYLPWALGVTVVAVAEEMLLRGSLFSAVQQRAGTTAAIGLTSVAFALLHVPLYGTSVFLLDLGVGVWLGALRAVSGSVLAPAIAHTLADLAGWWLR